MLLELKEKLTVEDLYHGNFGIEREGLRVTQEGKLADTPHPEVFGDKLKNPFITTDFSESQIEMITPVCQTINQVHRSLASLYHQTIKGLQRKEYLWPQSMPCLLEEKQVVAIAHFTSDEEGRALMAYRKLLLDKYGAKKQLISGIHYNFSFSETLLKKLFLERGASQSYQLFKDQVYLKIVRQYLRYRWLLIYFLGASPVIDTSYLSECKAPLKQIARDSFSYEGAISFRNSSDGYQNKVPIYVDYKDVKSYVRSLQTYIDKQTLFSYKEFYSPVRLKARNPQRFMDSLKQEGISYLEIRSIDLNPFEPLGISKTDLQFIHLFILFLLESEEVEVENWQQEANFNAEQIAREGRCSSLRLKRRDEEVLMTEWALEILNKMKQINDTFGLYQEAMMDQKVNQLRYPEETISGKMVELMRRSSYLDLNLSLARRYKDSLKHHLVLGKRVKTVDLGKENETCLN
ncbi:bifunctional glutamate--cysteine ligase GshA/glutathione synthetase GshB [Turicibacter sp. TS3]|uniref:bifunctional glutamate--cysteine ligase GshA/glutathione synthetase GshB n=1 Tax=Turicibacter sp. TS3 TaxID=2304578 RepID=UPI001379CF86|nr:bifunctional glutamate--cysteine ligase GshA/glutathione synthetase GshB [Turicibacter sp. TS3]NCE78178.1 bifunctional glutamate--cysteine ligase GshA/glutathione synthetase GshB [Turicibacter sp. TS3]